MEQQILCENKSFKLFILFKNLINVWGGKRGQQGVKGSQYWYKYFSKNNVNNLFLVNKYTDIKKC